MDMMSSQRNRKFEQVANAVINHEYQDYLIYRRLADSHRKRGVRHGSSRREGLGKRADVFEELGEIKYSHYKFWAKYASLKPSEKVGKLRLYVMILIEAILGATFAIKLMERHEKLDGEKCKSLRQIVPDEDRAEFEQLLIDEEKNATRLAEQIHSSALKYMSFVILGLADAIVEISGIHAGSLGIYNSTKLTGLAGIVAGAAASISMASAAYAQAKQSFDGSAKVSALVTGGSYFVNAVLLAAPYFLTSDPMLALSASLSLAVVVLAFTSYYNSIISGSNFVRDFVELTSVTVGATVALLILGQAVRIHFGITV